MASPKPVVIEVLVYAPTMFFHCQHCEFVWQHTDGTPRFHQEQVESSIPRDLKEEYQRLSDWVLDVAEAYKGRVIFKIIDAASIEGVFKSLRYRVRRFPAMVADGQEKIVGLDFDRASDLIKRRLGD
jgi:hypothetical protein